MGLRVTLTGYTVNADKTLNVTYDVAWTDDKGTSVWRQSGTLRAPADSSKDAILAAIQQAVLGLPAVSAAVGLSALVGKTFEFDTSSKTWKQV